MSKNRRDFLCTAGSVAVSAAFPFSVGPVAFDEDCPESDLLGPLLQRKFCLPHPLYNAESAWRQSAVLAGLKQPQAEYVHEMYCMLAGHKQNFCNLNLNDYTIPIFEAKAGSESDTPLELKTYFGESWETSTLVAQQVQTGSQFAVKGIPSPEGVVRPSGPNCKNADGHLVLVDRVKLVEYDFFAATTVVDAQNESLGGGLDGNEIKFAGAIERFSLNGPGAQKAEPNCKIRDSARATGVPLLAGLLEPEDFQNGPTITHAMAFAIPRLRHIDPATHASPRDFVYPTTTTEIAFYNASPWALGAGERIRLREKIFDNMGIEISKCNLSPVAQRYLTALRTFGAYLVDGSGAFSFYAEDYRTGNLNLDLSGFNTLCGRDTVEPLPPGKSQWQLLVETLNEEFFNIPFAVQTTAGLQSNFDIIEDAIIPAGFEPACSVAEINAR